MKSTTPTWYKILGIIFALGLTWVLASFIDVWLSAGTSSWNLFELMLKLARAAKLGRGWKAAVLYARKLDVLTSKKSFLRIFLKVLNLDTAVLLTFS